MRGLRFILLLLYIVLCVLLLALWPLFMILLVLLPNLISLADNIRAMFKFRGKWLFLVTVCYYLASVLILGGMYTWGTYFTEASSNQAEDGMREAHLFIFLLLPAIGNGVQLLLALCSRPSEE